MEKSKFALIQDEILDAKYALVNGIEFEGLQGDGLKELLLTLQAQRAQQASGGSSRDEAAPPSKATTPKPKTPTHSKVRVKHSAKKAPLVAKVSLVKSPVVKSPVVEAKVGDKKRKSASSSPKKRLTPLAKEPKKQQRTSSADQLRHLRKSIMPGDILSLLMEIRVKGGWVVTWVRGEVTREMNRSGIFQIAFDHDKDGERSTHHESPEELEDTRWIHEQRLEIEHPDFFCGHGNNPPRGPDNSRPKGAWYLHASTGHIIDAAPAVGATSSSFMDDRMIV